MKANHNINDNNSINIISVGHVCILVASDKSQLIVSHEAVFVFAFIAKYWYLISSHVISISITGSSTLCTNSNSQSSFFW